MYNFIVPRRVDYSGWNLSFSDMSNGGDSVPTILINEFIECVDFRLESSLVVGKLNKGLSYRVSLLSDDQSDVDSHAFSDLNIKVGLLNDISDSVEHVTEHLASDIHNDVDWTLERLNAMKADLLDVISSIDSGIEEINKAEVLYNEQANKKD